MVDNDDELLNEKQSLVVVSFLTEVDLCGKKREREKTFSK